MRIRSALLAGKGESYLKTYKFECIELKGVRGTAVQPKEDYREIIESHAKDGWELVQIFGPTFGTYGKAAYIDIIFSRDKE